MNIVQVPALRSNYGALRTYPLRKIVLHWMNGTLSGTDSWFKNPAAKASAHYGVGKMGAIHQYVDEKYNAWHAGPGVNFESIGIENEGGPDKPSALCHDACAMLVADICKRYNLPCDRNTVKKHNEYMNTQCPGSLDVDYIISKANSIINGAPMKPFDYEIYLAGNDMYMRVLSDSINENITVKNLDTGWQGTVFCAKTPNNDGGPINIDIGKNLYEVNARGIVKQYDNRIVNPPTETCPVKLGKAEQEVKDLTSALTESKLREVNLNQAVETTIVEHHKEIEEMTAKQIQLVEMLAEKDETIQKLRVALAKSWLDNLIEWIKNLGGKKV